MIKITHQIINFYLENNKNPEISNLKIAENNKKLLEQKTWLFITLYKSWKVFWSSGSVKENKENIILELINNTISALKDDRFKNNKLKKEDLEKIKIRIDTVEWKKQIKWKDSITKINPAKSWILVIKPDYTKIAVILPKISKNIATAKDYIDILSSKLGEKYKEKDYINYELLTKQYTDS